MNNRGAIAVMTAALAIPLVLFVGLAVDASELWILRQRLQWSVDAAALLGASQLNSVVALQVQHDAQELFWVNYGASATKWTSPAPQAGFIGATSPGATVAVGTTDVTVTASATLSMSFMRIIPGFTTTTISATATAAVPRNVEMALVLDNSLSMGLQLAQNSSTTKLQAMQTAAQGMLTTMFGGASAPPNVFVSVIPFAGAVNAGNANTSFLDPVSYAADFPASTNPDAAWRGCTQARASPDDLSEIPPSQASSTPPVTAATGLFTPYYSKSTYNVAARPPKTGGYYPGDNDWIPANGTKVASGITDTSTSSQSGDTNYISPTGFTMAGPNLFCPRAPVVKLTNTPGPISTALNGMTIVNGGGTVIIQGLQWGWFTLSPGWATQWNLPNTNTNLTRPLAYANTTNTKIIVLMTDGVNEIDGADSFYGAAAVNYGSGNYNCNANTNPNNLIYPECLYPDSWYTSYGRISSKTLVTPPATDPNPIGTGATYMNNASNILTTRMATLCTNIKQNNQIIIYTIFFHGYVDDSSLGALTNGASANLQACATDSAHFFNSTSATDINAAFQKIARDISNLRITK